MNGQPPTFDIEHSTSNRSKDASEIERSVFDVECLVLRPGASYPVAALSPAKMVSICPPARAARV
jgi:hypothetical protein